MDHDDLLKRETETLIEAIWGRRAVEPPRPLDLAARTAQNEALATAMRAYLQQYLNEL